MRILYLTPTGVFSGGERVTLSIAAEMQRRGHETVYCGLEGPIRGFVEDAGLRFAALPGFTPEAVRSAAADLSPALVHAMDFRASTYAALLKTPLIAHLHNNPPWLSGLGPNVWGMRLFCERAARILTVSASVMNEYRFGRRYLKKTVVLPNVVDVQAVRAAAALPPEGIPAQAAYDLLFFGRLTEQKQPLRFLSIVAALRQDFPALRALMIGDGELRGQVEAAVRVNGLTDCVTLAGFLPRPFPAAARCRMLLMPSAWEGFGLTAVEAMALGLPVLAAPVGGLGEVVAPDCGALCVTEPDYLEAAAALLSDGARYDAASRAARLRAEVFGDQKSYFDAVAALSEAAAAGGSPP